MLGIGGATEARGLTVVGSPSWMGVPALRAVTWRCLGGPDRGPYMQSMAGEVLQVRLQINETHDGMFLTIFSAFRKHKLLFLLTATTQQLAN